MRINRKQIGEAFRAKRESLGMTQRALGMKIHNKPQNTTVSAIENGRSYSIVKLQTACNALGCTIEDLKKSYVTAMENRAPISPAIERKANDWTITVGGYRLTLSGIGEPEAVLLERI